MEVKNAVFNPRPGREHHEFRRVGSFVSGQTNVRELGWENRRSVAVLHAGGRWETSWPMGEGGLVNIPDDSISAGRREMGAATREVGGGWGER